MITPRQASVDITYTPKGGEAVRLSDEVGQFFGGFDYSDAATGESDTISIKVSNRDLRWIDAWMPKKGDKVEATICLDDGGASSRFCCGKFCCDDVKFSGPQLECEIGAVSVPEGQAFRTTERTYTWEQVTVEEMGRRIAARYSLQFEYDAPTVTVKSKEQSGQTDCDFLNGVCTDYGMYMKVYFGKLVIYDIDIYEENAPVRTYALDDFLSWNYNTTLTGTYTGATIKYTDGDNDTELSLTVGGGDRILNVSEKVDSEADAQKKACAAVNKANREAVTLSADIIPDVGIAAGCCIQLTGAYSLNGKYFIDKISHSITPSGTYGMSLEMHKVQPKIKTVTNRSAMSGGGDGASTGHKVGDVVNFKGGKHYVSSWASSKGYNAKPGPAKITMGPDCAGNGKAHPWHLIHTDKTSNVYGWVDEGTFD